MNSVLFAKMDQVFSKENKTLKKYWKFGKKILEKSGNFVSPEKWQPCLCGGRFVPWHPTVAVDLQLAGCSGTILHPYEGTVAVDL